MAGRILVTHGGISKLNRRLQSGVATHPFARPAAYAVMRFTRSDAGLVRQARRSSRRNLYHPHP